MLRSTDMVIAGNSFLRDMTARDGLRVELLPTPCPAETCRRNPGPGGSIGRKLVWIGSRSTLKYLQMLVGVFRRLSGLFPDLQLMVISDSFEDVEGIRTQFIRWTEATEYGSLVQGDIGLMPLYDNDWCRGKCGYKIIQYMACGIPAVASPVGFNAQLIRDGENGFLADSEEDWVRKISLLLEDKKAYMDMSLKARRTFEEGYRVEPSAKKLSGYLRSLTGRAPA
jgi:glycosyltransferase involved in cell wall biosynthesis